MSAADYAKLLEQIAAELRQIGTGADAIDQLARLELLRGDEAALVGGRDTSTVARWAAAAEDEGVPIAIKVGTSWLFVAARLLGYIRRTSSLYARREAETRLGKLREMRASAQTPNQNARPRAASAPKTCDNRHSKIALDQEDHSIPEAQAVDME